MSFVVETGALFRSSPLPFLLISRIKTPISPISLLLRAHNWHPPQELPSTEENLPNPGLSIKSKNYNWGAQRFVVWLQDRIALNYSFTCRAPVWPAEASIETISQFKLHLLSPSPLTRCCLSTPPSKPLADLLHFRSGNPTWNIIILRASKPQEANPQSLKWLFLNQPVARVESVIVRRRMKQNKKFGLILFWLPSYNWK